MKNTVDGCVEGRFGRMDGKQRDGTKVHKGGQTTTTTYILFRLLRHEGGRARDVWYDKRFNKMREDGE